ncbi:TPA: recombinase RecA [Candidatus Dependentiae bacterium]|nr:MAG: Protein RecA [candidate division TM6 bacterium GW2011_GWE2_31_21]KKP53585.1 MAG: Protein RecA [candidate division TM6 bacterium GW2011_GWF2_33_332]HBS48175.1 recombinase RecA [Candidatus Dependentiae bacterium]HBZ73599.1 recombinase RecA [Candidatus Dependentiae bacterium]
MASATEKKTQLQSNKILSEEKIKVLEIAFAQIDKEYGKGSVMILGQNSACKNLETISTGSIAIDQALGVGGFPRGRVIEIYGPESSGKTTLTLHAIAEAQKKGGVCAFIDAEHALDSGYASRIGVDVDKLVISQPDYGEQALDIAEVLIRSGAIDVLVIDSVAALVPKAELEGDMGDAHIGLQARLMSQALRKLTPTVHKSKTIVIFINQIRQKVGGMAFMNNEVTSGGNALKFYASIRLDIRRIATLKKDEKPFGNRVSVKVVKNKVAPPFKKVEVDILFNEGISRELDLFDFALSCNILQQSGAWFTFGSEKLAQGRENCLKLLKTDANLYQSIRDLVTKKIQEGVELKTETEE